MSFSRGFCVGAITIFLMALLVQLVPRSFFELYPLASSFLCGMVPPSAAAFIVTKIP